MPRLYVAGGQFKSPLGLGLFSSFFTFQLHVSGSLYSQALSFLTGPYGGILHAFTEPSRAVEHAKE